MLHCEAGYKLELWKGILFCWNHYGLHQILKLCILLKQHYIPAKIRRPIQRHHSL